MQQNVPDTTRSSSTAPHEHPSSPPDQIGQLLGRFEAPSMLRTVDLGDATVKEIRQWVKENKEGLSREFALGWKKKQELVEMLLGCGITKLEFHSIPEAGFSSSRKEKRQQKNNPQVENVSEAEEYSEEEAWNLIKSNQWYITNRMSYLPSSSRNEEHSYHSSDLPPFERMMAKLMVCPHCQKDRQHPVSPEIYAPMPIQPPAEQEQLPAQSPSPTPRSPTPPQPPQETVSNLRKKRKYARINSRFVDVSFETCDGTITIHAEQSTGQGNLRREKNGTVEVKSFRVPTQAPATPPSDTWVKRYRHWHVKTDDASFPPMVIWSLLWSYAKEDPVIQRLWKTYPHVVSSTKTFVDQIDRLGLEQFNTKANGYKLEDLIELIQAENKELELRDARHKIKETIATFENPQAFWEYYNIAEQNRPGFPSDRQILDVGRAIRKEQGTELDLKPRRTFREDNPSDIETE